MNRNFRIAFGIAWSLAGCLLVQAQAVPPPPPPQSQAILAAARAALASPGAAPLKSLELKGKFRSQPIGGNRQQQGKLTLLFLQPGQYQRRMSLHLPFGDIKIVQTLNQGKVWTERQFPGGGPMMFMRRGGPGGKLTPAQRKKIQDRMRRRMRQNLLRQAARDQLIYLLLPGPGAVTHFAGIARAPDGTVADMVQVTGAAGGQTTLFINRANHRLLMATYQGTVPQAPPGGRGRRGPWAQMRRQRQAGQPGGFTPPAPQPIQVHFSHWRRVRGYWLPFRITETSQGKTFSEIDVKKARLNSARITPQLFVKKKS